MDKSADKVTISKALLEKIVAYFMGGGLPEDIDEYADDSDEAIIYDALADEFPPDELERIFPGEFDFTDE